MELPRFKYHPDPLATGSIKLSEEMCVCCGQARGFIYASSAYSVADLSHKLCPWCIADGSAHREFDASFNDAFCLHELPAEVIDEVAHRTPAFNTWQQGSWWTHCGDAGAYLGDAEQVKLEPAQIEEIIEALRADCDGLSLEDWRKYFLAPGVGTSVSVYVFRCLHCGRIGGCWDCD